MFEADMCCGMGGSYSLKLPEISAPILQRKLTNIKGTGASMWRWIARDALCRFAAGWTRTARRSK
ncbi:MAG: (Fe-S)-binding protein [Ignavibacteriota bacterium]